MVRREAFDSPFDAAPLANRVADENAAACYLKRLSRGRHRERQRARCCQRCRQLSGSTTRAQTHAASVAERLAIRDKLLRLGCGSGFVASLDATRLLARTLFGRPHRAVAKKLHPLLFRYQLISADYQLISADYRRRQPRLPVGVGHVELGAA